MIYTVQGTHLSGIVEKHIISEVLPRVGDFLQIDGEDHEVIVVWHIILPAVIADSGHVQEYIVRVK